MTADEPVRSSEARAVAELALVRVVHHYGQKPGFVLIGGLVPQLLCSNSAFRHAGTTDVDVQVDLEIARGATHTRRLEQALPEIPTSQPTLALIPHRCSSPAGDCHRPPAAAPHGRITSAGGTSPNAERLVWRSWLWPQTRKRGRSRGGLLGPSWGGAAPRVHDAR